jgi:hypothetical protein
MQKRQKITNLVFKSEENAYNAGEIAAAWVKSKLHGIAIVSVGLGVVAVFGALAAVVGFVREISKGGNRE